MGKHMKYFLLICWGSWLLSGTVLAQSATNTKPEKFEMKIDAGSNVLSFNKLSVQKPPEPGKPVATRGFNGMIVSKVVEGIQKMIDNRQKKYSTEYTFSKKDERFYQDISKDGPFDPTGIRFKGFSISRLFKGEDGGVVDTAFVARFTVDTEPEALQEMLNNGIFRLSLESLTLKIPRVAVPEKNSKLNMDFEISLLSSFINEGVMNREVLVGKFIYAVRNAPLDPNDPGYATYYQDLQKTSCIGQSFLIPRSAGYYKSDKGLDKCWGEGFYTLKVTVKESSKNNFVDKLISFGSEDMMTLGKEALRKKYGN
jgi:hypothetical protein